MSYFPEHRSISLAAGIVAAAVFLAWTAFAQEKAPTCGEGVKAEVAKLLGAEAIQKDPESTEAKALEKEVYDKYQICLQDAKTLDVISDATKSEFCGTLSYLGNTTFEKMRCCGYDPQKMLFGCPVEILLPIGFGAAPMPGSYENVLTCVDFGKGYVPIARDRVHLANAVSRGPIWNFAVIARARDQLAQTPLKGQTLWARSILSWGFTPTNCTFRPYWGNVIDYKIRLDP